MPTKTPKLNEQERKDRRQLTDLIQEMWGEGVNWPLLTAQLKNIMEDYELTHKEVYYILKYCRDYEQVPVNTDYGLYQFIPKYIMAVEEFRVKLAEAREKADEIGKILPIKVKKYRPQHKLKTSLTFD